jgi:hypothetical protein
MEAVGGLRKCAHRCRADVSRSLRGDPPSVGRRPTPSIKGVGVPTTLGGLRHALRCVQDLTLGGYAWLTLH